MAKEESKKSYTLTELCRLVGGRLEGSGEVVIRGVCGIEDAGEGEITFVANVKYVGYITTTKASAIIVDPTTDHGSIPAIVTENPYLAFGIILQHFAPPIPHIPPGIDSRALVSESARLGEGVAVGPFAVICDDVLVGDATTVGAGCFIAPQTSLGRDCYLHPNVVVRERTEIGDRVIIHSGTVVGSDGFGYAKTEDGYQKVPQTGIVVIEDDVEIGANVAIDRATMGVTRICKGSKIDNLVQIAHNVVIGKNSIIVAQVGISGSTVIGEEVTLGGQVGIIGHVKIGDRVMVGAQSGISKDIPAGESWFGYPARPIARQKRIEAFLSRYDNYVKRVAELEKRVAELEKKKKGKKDR